MDNTYQLEYSDLLDRNMTLEAYSELIQLREQNKELTKESLINILDKNMTLEAYSELLSSQKMEVSSEEHEDTSDKTEDTSSENEISSDKKSIFKRIIDLIKDFLKGGSTCESLDSKNCKQ